MEDQADLDDLGGEPTSEVAKLRKERQMAVNRHAQHRHREKRKAKEVELVAKIDMLEKDLTESRGVQEENQRLKTYLELVVRHSDLLKQELEFKNLQLNTIKPGTVPDTAPTELPLPPVPFEGTSFSCRKLLHSVDSVLERRVVLAPNRPPGALNALFASTSNSMAESGPPPFDLDQVKDQNMATFLDTVHSHGNHWSMRPDTDSGPGASGAHDEKPSEQAIEDMVAHYGAVCSRLREAVKVHLATNPDAPLQPHGEIPRMLGECKVIFAKLATLKGTSLRDVNLSSSKKIKPEAPTDYQNNADQSTSKWLMCVLAMKLQANQITTLLQHRHTHLEELTAIYDHRRVITRHAMQLAESLSVFVRGITPTGITPEVWESHTVMKSTLEDINNSLTDEQGLFKKFHVATWGVLTPIQSAIFITEVGPIYPDMLALVNSLAYIHQQQHAQGRLAAGNVPIMPFMF